VTFVLIPPLILIFLVLGTIFLGLATPTEGGAMGAVGALIMAGARRRLTWRVLVQALASTSRLSVFVLFILIGSTVFAFTFNAADGHIWVEHLFDKLPGGELGFLIFVELAGVHPRDVHRLLRDRLHRRAHPGAGGREDGHRPDLVRRHPGDERCRPRS
jgi:TRAP-type mannitol/chloroaromatic compound transport system permease large subunit